MKKFTFILSFTAITTLLFTGCYTQLTTQDRDYSGSESQETYSGDQEYASQGRDTYADSSENYSGNYYDSTGYYDNNSYSSSPYYYDDFYYSYPTYRRYFWSYQPSIVIGFSWPGWYYDPFYYSPYYYSFWYSWYYPGGWCCTPYYYYYPSPWYFGYNYNYYGWYPGYTHYYYTARERTRDMTRIRNLDGLRGSGGRGDLISSRDRSSVQSVTDRSRTSTGISPAPRSSKTARVESRRNLIRKDREGVKTSRNIDNQITRRPAERKSVIADEKRGRILTGTKEQKATDANTIGRTVRSEKSKFKPDTEKRNEGRSSNGNIRPRSYPTPSVEYKPQKRSGTSKSYTPPKRNTTPKSYTPPRRNTTPKSYTPPKRKSTPKSYTPPKRNTTPRSYSPPQRNSTPRSYSPPQRSSSPPARSSGSRSGGSSSGRSRK